MNRTQLQEKLLPLAHHKETKYLRWYLNIIENANSYNRTKLNRLNEEYIYYENHHILPKAKGLFDEYKDLNKFPWNGVLLTAKEHFICHRLIQKHYAKIKYTLGDRKMSHAIKLMSNDGRYSARHYTYFRLNLTHSVESKKKMSISQSGRKHTEESKKKMSIHSRKPMLGKTHTDETKKKMSNSHKGKIRTEAHRKNLSESHKGKIISEEQKKKIGKANKGKIRSEETKRKMSISLSGKNNPNYGKSISKEQKKKISEANKGKQKIITCPHCEKIGGNNAMKRYHFDNCKFK